MSKNNVISLGRKHSKKVRVETIEGNNIAAKQLKESLSRDKSIQDHSSASKSNFTCKTEIDDEPSSILREKKLNSSETTDSVSKVNIGSSNGDIEISEAEIEATTSILKARSAEEQRKKLNRYANNVDDKVRLHEKGWKVIALEPQIQF